jgi:hypothetical protein
LELEPLPADAQAEFRARAFARLREMKGAQGIPERFNALFTRATRPAYRAAAEEMRNG